MPLHAPIDAVCFDWGGTLMSEAGPEALPMGMWPEVSSIPGARECLAALYNLAPLCIATNATVSRRPMIERALARVGLRHYIATIFCYTELGYRKSQPEFWRAVESALHVPPSRIAMVGDSLEHDVLAPRTFGVQAVWFNEGGARTQADAGVAEVRSLVEFAELVRPALRAKSA